MLKYLYLFILPLLFGAVPKTKEEARANFETAIPYIGSRYEAGVKRADWQGPASSDQAERNYAENVTKAVSEKSRQRKIQAMSNQDWQQAAAEKGAPIIGERVRMNLDKWARNWGPLYDQVVAEVGRLPAKTTDFRANITNRLVKVVESWKKAAGKL